MVSRRLLVLAAVVVTVLALGAAATAVENLDGSEREPGGSAGEGTDPISGDLIPFLEIPGWALVLGLFLLVATALVGLVLLPEERRRFFRNMAIVLVFALLFLLVADVAQVALLDEDRNPENVTGGGEVEGEEMPDETEGGDGDTTISPLLPILGLLVAGLVGALLVLWLLTGEGEEEPAVDTDTERREAVGRAAGRAADRIDDDSLENAVYQAWHEMTDALDVSNPGARTPAEFERAAVEAGLDGGDVETLTDLFRTVRYGDAPVTTERERRARETLRRIETTYADAGPVSEAGPAGAADTDADGDGSGGESP